MEGRDELHTLIAQATEYAEGGARCMRTMNEEPTAIAGLARAAERHGERLAALAGEIRRLAKARPVLAEHLGADRCAMLDDWIGRRQLDAGDGLRPFGRERGARPAG